MITSFKFSIAIFSIYIYMLRFKFNYILKDTPYKLLAEINIYPKSRPKANISIVEQTVWTLWCKSKSKMKMKENKEVRTIHSLNISSVSEASTGKQEHSFFFFLWNCKLLKIHLGGQYGNIWWVPYHLGITCLCMDPGEINNCMSVLDSVNKDVHRSNLWSKQLEKINPN